MESHYDILGVSHNANDSDIKKAYRSLSYKFHPDKNNGDAKKSERYTKINEAYETLSDITKRQQYDFENSMNDRGDGIDIMMNQFMNGFLNKINKKNTSTHSHNDPFIHLFQNMSSPHDFEEVVFLNSCRQPEIPKSKQKPIPVPEELQEILEISFKQAYEGCCVPLIVKRTIQISERVTEEQEEKIYINIPKGTDHLERIELKNKGNIIDQQQSDLIILVQLKPDSVFKRQGLNLILKHSISFKESVLGFSFVIHHLKGNQLKMNHKRGNVIVNGTQKTIKGLGFERGDTTGDLILEFNVEMPLEFTEEQLQLIETHF